MMGGAERRRDGRGIRAAALLLVLLLMAGCSGPRQYVREDAGVRTIKKIAVLPLASLTADENAGEKIRGLVISELLSRGVDVVEPGEVTRALLEMKVRSLGALTVDDFKALGKRLKVKALMTGSVAAYGMSRGITTTYPEVSIHLMLIDTSNGEIVWSVWHTAGGPSFWTRHFGTEGLTLSETARKAVREAIGALL